MRGAYGKGKQILTLCFRERASSKVEEGKCAESISFVKVTIDPGYENRAMKIPKQGKQLTKSLLEADFLLPVRTGFIRLLYA
jgi:hypothetical protein